LSTWGWSVHPNPARDGFRLQLPSDLECVEVRLYDAMGRWVRSWTGLACTAELAVGDLEPGTYLVTIETASGVTATQRLQVTGR
ncbi:MAG: Secretion system C-terminal sorting domain, partial [Bacteroidota bacterium]